MGSFTKVADIHHRTFASSVHAPTFVAFRLIKPIVGDALLNDMLLP